MRKAKTVLGVFAVVLILVGFLSPASLWAQAQDASSSSNELQTGPSSDNAGSKDEGPQPGESSSAAVAPTVQPALRVREAGRAGLLLTHVSPLRWGAVYLQSAEFQQGFNSIRPHGQVSAAFPERTFVTSSFRGRIVYNRQFRRSVLALQYSPRVSIINREVFQNFTNQHLTLDTDYQLSPRWTVGFNNEFIYYRTDNLFGDFYLDADSVRSSTLQNNFVDGPGRWLTNGTSTMFGYQMGPRDQVAFGGNFGYSHNSGSAITPEPFSSRSFGGIVRWERQMSATRTIGAYYSYRVLEVSKDNYRNTPYQTMEMSYSQGLGRRFTLNTSAGVTSSAFESGRQWFLSGSVSLVRTLNRGAVWVAYTRGQPLLAELGVQGSADRIDLSYRADLTRRWSWRTDFGYQRTISSSTESIEATYATTQLNFRMLSQVSWFVSYGRKWQSGDVTQVFRGTRDVVFTGLRWEGRPVQQ